LKEDLARGVCVSSNLAALFLTWADSTSAKFFLYLGFYRQKLIDGTLLEFSILVYQSINNKPYYEPKKYQKKAIQKIAPSICINHHQPSIIHR
jgi:hypothetical protein